ncbi:MAG: nucleotide sugar dehydrogenase [Candidatus Helarchaeota archaeon]
MNLNPEIVKSKFMKGEITFTIIGLGRIGLPTAAMIANKGIKVYGYDINEQLINNLKSGIATIDEPELDKIVKNIINKKFLIPTTDPELAVKNSDVIIICLPTPVSSEKIPDYSAIYNCFNEISSYIKKGSLIIIESTVSPGTVENLIIPTIEKNSKLKVSKDFGIASCPERANPGEIIYRFKKTPRIIGGIDKKSTEIAVSIYRCIVDSELIVVSNPKTANAVKLTENIFRDVNIALMNELAILFGKLGIDTIEIIKAASTKWNFVPHYPGAGVGGPCLPANPYYLIQEAIKVDYVPHLIRMAREINDRMPHHLVELISQTLNIIGKPVKKTKITILGISYKPNIADYQLSPVFPVYNELLKLKAILKVYDPFFKGQTIKNIKIEDNFEDSIKNSECIVIMTEHQEFKNIDLKALTKLTETPLVIVDGRNTFDINNIPSNIIYRSIGRTLINNT